VDETEVRNEAERHANATVAGDFKTAGASLTEPAMGQAGGVMKAMPGKLTACEITSLTAAGDGGFHVDIRYIAENGDVTVRSTWGEVDGSPKITNLEVL
jgi:hypothetical protein